MQKPKKEADRLSRTLTEKSQNGKNGNKNGKKWQNIGMSFRAKINRLQCAKNLTYKEYYPHPQKPTQAKFEALQSITKAKPTDRTQNKTENTRGEPPKIALEPPNVPPHIFTYAHKKKTPHRAKKTPCKA